MYDFDEIIDRSGTNSIKYDIGQKMLPDQAEDYIPMWIADMDFACPQPVLDAMHARLKRRILGYSVIADPEYYTALGKWMEERHHWKVDPHTSQFSSGVITVLDAAVERLTEAGDSVLLNTPAYHPFDDAIKKHSRQPVYNGLVCRTGRYEVDWADFEAKAKDPKVSLFFLCNPHNPTGRVWTKEELQHFGDICFANNVFVVSDEIHFDFVRAGVEHTVFASLFPQEKRIITCTAPSKTFNLAGNHFSNIFFGDSEIAYTWARAMILGQPSPLSIEACKAAYLYCADWLDELNIYLDKNFCHLKARIERELPDVNFCIPEATYLAWLDVSGCGIPDKELSERLMRMGLHIEYGNEFVNNGAGYVRVNIACPRSVLDKAVDCLVRAICLR